MTDGMKPYSEVRDAFLGDIKTFVDRMYGERCQDMSPICPCCQAWYLYDQFAKLTDPLRDVD